jgi:hypothetical protein
VITGTDKDGGKIKRVGNNAGVRVSDTVKNGAGITTRERVVGESRTVITSEPEIAPVRVAKEYKIREANRQLGPSGACNPEDSMESSVRLQFPMMNQA